MDGLRMVMRGRQQIGFLLLSFLLMLLAVAGSYFASFYAANAASAEVLEDSLAQFGVTAEYLRSEFPENSDERIAELASRVVERTDDADVAAGEAALRKYGYRRGMDMRLLNSYDEIHALTNTVARRVTLISCAGIVILGVIFLMSLQRNLAKIHDYAQSVLGSLDAGEVNSYCGSCGLLHTAISTLGTRFSNLLTAFENERDYLKDFISDISHQMKTPLAVLRMNNEIMLDEPNMPQESSHEFLSQSEAQLSRLEWLVSGLLRLAKIDANVVEFSFENESLARTAALAVEYYAPAAKKKGVSLINNVPDEIFVTHDREWTAEAIGNVIKNSIEHTPSGGKIELTAEESPLTAYLDITDSGSGIAPDVLPHIFERFYTSGSGVSIANIGIGLPLSKSILDRHGAYIRALSPPEGGTTMHITFFKSR